MKIDCQIEIELGYLVSVFFTIAFRIGRSEERSENTQLNFNVHRLFTMSYLRIIDPAIPEFAKDWRGSCFILHAGVRPDSALR